MEQEDALRNGTLLERPYPWMPTEMLNRKDEHIQKYNELLLEASAGRCSLSNSMTLRPKVSDAYGVVATRLIRKGDTLLVDHTTTAVIEKAQTCPVCFEGLGSKAKKMVCCSDKFCSQSCTDKALVSFHKATCGKSFTFPGLEPLGTSFRNHVMILLRVLAIIVQAEDGQAHLLYNPTVNCLTPNYTSGPDPWTYHEDVIYPVEMLQTMGIDVFADLRYDTWVVRNILSRIRNNACGQGSGTESDIYLCLNPLYSMFNHSCHPNTGWEHQGDTSSIRIFAEKDIIVERNCLFRTRVI